MAASRKDTLLAKFIDETDFQGIMNIFKDICTEIGIDPTQYTGLYPAYTSLFTHWKARPLFQLLDTRAKQAEYDGQRACAGKRVLIIGAGPVGLRAAIEAAFLGAKVDVLEKRVSFTRNNTLHLWPFVVTDLKNLGAKMFYSRFCSAGIDHICIRILQSILLRVCLILGVNVHPGVTFNELIEPTDSSGGWTISTTPAFATLSSYHFDVVIGANGKNSCLPGFKTKELRAKLAIAITANYIYTHSKKESIVKEIGGLSYVFDQNLFKTLSEQLGIELENFVYFKGETHYFVMTAKKASLLKKGVIKTNKSDPALLLSPDNIDREALEQFTTEAVKFSTKDSLGDILFEKNHRGENDVALFDFTSMYYSENASRIVERKGKKILLCIAGDSLLEPFWPTGTGCARGFLGAFDDMWMMKRFCAEDDPLEIIKERESILSLLGKTFSASLHKAYNTYSIDPSTRYQHLKRLTPPGDFSYLYDTDDSNVVNSSSKKNAGKESDNMKVEASVIAVE